MRQSSVCRLAGRSLQHRTRPGIRCNHSEANLDLQRGSSPLLSTQTPRWSSFFLNNGGVLEWARARGQKQQQAATASLTDFVSDQDSPRTALAPSLQTTLANKSASELEAAGFKQLPAKQSISDLYKLYKGLAKARLSGWIVLTAMAGYAMCPYDPATAALATDAFLSSLPASFPSVAVENTLGMTNTLSLPVLLSTAIGTLLCSTSANTINQLSEVPYDAQMVRTRNRVLVRRALTPLHASAFAGVTGVVGVGTLAAFVNPLVASLGLANIILYAFVYTPLKRMSIVNTWVGAVVGGIPPLMGWAACTGTLDLATQPGAWAMFSLLFAWQFPHFNALAHTMRHDYAKTGYAMMAATHPDLNARVALRYSLAFFPICAVFPALGLTSAWFAILSAVPNAALTWASFRFWWDPIKRARHARILFWASLAHLPILLVLMMACKEGHWWPTRPQQQVTSRKVQEIEE